MSNTYNSQIEYKSDKVDILSPIYNQKNSVLPKLVLQRVPDLSKKKRTKLPGFIGNMSARFLYRFSNGNRVYVKIDIYT